MRLKINQTLLKGTVNQRFQLSINCEAVHTQGIEHVYVTLTTWWKFSITPPKHSQSWKEVQKVLDLPELRIGNKTSSRNCTWCSISEKNNYLFRCLHRVESVLSASILSKQPKDNLKTQLKGLHVTTNDTLLPNLHKLACCYLLLPI